MSTIKVNNLQTSSGGSNSTPEEILQGRAKAWVNFNGTGTVSIRSDYNISSITDHGTGQYTMNFSTAFADTNYAECLATSGDINDGCVLRSYAGSSPHGKTTSGVRIQARQLNNGSLGDTASVTASFFADS
jgi:hypothetical protein